MSAAVADRRAGRGTPLPVLGALNSYVLNRRWSFRSHELPAPAPALRRRSGGSTIAI